MATSSLLKTITTFSLFQGFSPEEVWQILASGKVVQLKPGEILISPGTSNDTLYLLIDGELRVVLEKDEVEVSIPILPGECLGEMSLVVGGPTSALAVAHHISRVLFIPEDIFWNQLAVTRHGVRNLLSMMAQRLQRNNEELIKKVEEQLKYQLLEKELETAGKIQSHIVPDGKNLFPNCPEVDAYALMNQAREVGGDFYDALVLDDDHVYMAIGDVSGKGMPAALFMMQIFTSLRLLISNNTPFEEVLPSVNNMLVRNNGDMMFVSIFAGVLNIRTGLFRYVNAGHNPPFAALGGDDFKLLNLPGGTLIGILDQAKFPVTELQLEPGDSLLLYTDGIPEATNSEHIMFDVARTQYVLNKEYHESMNALVQSLKVAVEAFVNKAPQHDDYTLFALRYHGN
ncbi:MAG: SpoIIE family protein phosphatase [Saprospirales bacterium]|nr:SpoIIE family protein phosphatase [Saprospirales bacterium]